MLIPFSRALIECHIDAGQKEEAIQVSQAALSFAKTNAPHIYKEVFALQVCRFFHLDLLNTLYMHNTPWISTFPNRYLFLRH